MPEIAIGRKEIMKELRVEAWNTVRAWKKHHGLPIRYLPNQKPMIIIDELKAWIATRTEKPQT